MITSIKTIGIVTCPDCDTANEIEIARPSSSLRCEGCGKYLTWRQPRATIRDVLSLFGFSLAIDWDGQLMVESEQPVPASVREWLFHHQGELRESFERSGMAARSVFVGGSLAGQKHGEGYGWGKRRVVIRIGPRHWEAYECRERSDPRFYFVGRATSEAKAKRGAFEVANR